MKKTIKVLSLVALLVSVGVVLRMETLEARCEAADITLEQCPII